MKEKIIQTLFRPVNSRSLEWFRIIFSSILVLQFFSFYKYDYLNSGILAPRFLFYFDWTPFIKPLPAGWMKLVMLLLFVAPVFMLLNKFFRIANVLFMVCFAYLFLLEESYYNNHFYFILLLCLFFCFYKPIKQPDGATVVPNWLLWLFRFQVIVVYFYGGLAKINSDWIFHQQPVRELLNMNHAKSPFPGLANSEFAVFYITYGGILFDLIIGFLLCWRKTFKAAVLFTLVFHITNTWIFNFGEGGDIGIFPFLMIGANVLFAEPEVLQRILKKRKAGFVKKTAVHQTSKSTENILFRPLKVLPFLVVFVALQVLLPFRHLLVPGNTEWTGQQQFFAWRMKLHSKETTVKFILKRFENDTPVEVNIGQHINTMQANMMTQHADMIYKFVQYIKRDLHDRLKINKAIIHAEIKVSFNGRPENYFIDPNLDLFNITYKPSGKNEWINPCPGY